MKILVIDVGTSGVRAAVVEPGRGVVHSRRQEVLPSSPEPGLVEFDAPELAAGLWTRLHARVDPEHEGAPVRAVNTRFRVYRYELGQRFAPHQDVRTRVPGGMEHGPSPSGRP